MNTETNIPQLARRLINGIVADTSLVRLNVTDSSHMMVISTQVSRSDTPRLIGRKGKTYQALHRLLEGMAERQGKRFRIFVGEPVGGEPSKMRFSQRSDWPVDDVTRLVRDTFEALTGSPVGVYVRREDYRGMIMVQVETMIGDELIKAAQIVFASIGFQIGATLMLDVACPALQPTSKD